jgi:hypothetical protein
MGEALLFLAVRADRSGLAVRCSIYAEFIGSARIK